MNANTFSLPNVAVDVWESFHCVPFTRTVQLINVVVQIVQSLNFERKLTTHEMLLTVYKSICSYRFPLLRILFTLIRVIVVYVGGLCN